jgi:secreted PhoX family phosphatase
MGLEDGDIGNCQLYMYVGFKDRSPGASPLRRNGLDNGSLYVFVSSNRRKNSEVTVQNGSVPGKWVLLPGAEALTDVQLEVAADSVGAFAFDRIEDGAFRPNHPNEFYFVTTGGSAANALGRLYRLDLNPDNLFGPARITVIYNADEVIADGGDIAISPDNVGVTEDSILICEDGTAQSSAVMAAKGRKGNIWRLDINNNYAAENIAELMAIGRDGREVPSGNWETSGIIDTSGLFGPGTWLFDVQAHPPTAMPAPNTAEDGQLLMLVPRR